LTILHQWKDELLIQDNKDSDWVGIPSPYSPEGILYHYDYEQSFLAQFNLCSQGVYHAVRFRSDLTNYLYPNAKIPDRYMHAPLIGHDETSNEGMMLANASMLEILGLL
jgi:hypothetical protein